MKFTIECEQEEAGRWLAEVIELPGVLAYGRTRKEAISKAQALGLRVLADRIQHGEELAARVTTGHGSVKGVAHVDRIHPRGNEPRNL